MIPTKNNSHNGCDPISSNCVIWQGPDIPCIELCNGDTVSEVVAKLAEKVCDLIDATCECNPELSIDPSCLVVEDPTNLDQVLQAIIDLLCAQKGGDSEQIIVVYPECLREGDIVQAPIQDYVVVLANKICEILTQLTIIQNAIVDLTSRSQRYFILYNPRRSRSSCINIIISIRIRLLCFEKRSWNRCSS
jgi:hypothetical protein